MNLPVSRRVLGQRIKYLRQGLRMTLEQLEAASDVPKSNLSRWERGQFWPRVDRLARVAVALGVTPDVLLGFKELPADTWAEQSWPGAERPLPKPKLVTGGNS